MIEGYRTFEEHEQTGRYPGKWTLYNWTRNQDKLDPMLRAGVIVRVNNRWLFNEKKWQEFCEKSAAA